MTRSGREGFFDSLRCQKEKKSDHNRGGYGPPMDHILRLESESPKHLYHLMGATPPSIVYTSSLLNLSTPQLLAPSCLVHPTSQLRLSLPPPICTVSSLIIGGALLHPRELLEKTYTKMALGHMVCMSCMSCVSCMICMYYVPSICRAIERCTTVRHRAPHMA